MRGEKNESYTGVGHGRSQKTPILGRIKHYTLHTLRHTCKGLNQIKAPIESPKQSHFRRERTEKKTQTCMLGVYRSCCLCEYEEQTPSSSDDNQTTSHLQKGDVFSQQHGERMLPVAKILMCHNQSAPLVYSSDITEVAMQQALFMDSYNAHMIDASRLFDRSPQQKKPNTCCFCRAV